MSRRHPVPVLLLALLAVGAAPRGPAAARAEEPASLEPLVQGTNGFGLDLLRTLAATEPGNLFLSPYSVAVALGMAWEGARGETAAEMARVLHLPEHAVGEAHRALRAGLAPGTVTDGFGRDRREVPAYALEIANALWVQDGFPFEAGFLGRLREAWGAPAERVDYADPAAVRARINGWASAATKERIPELLPPDVPTTDTRMILANAVWFKAAWEDAFSERATGPRTFHRPDGSTVEAPFLRRTASYRTAETEDAQVLELPYRGGEMVMLVVLPRAADGLPALERTLTAARLEGWTSALAYQRVAVELPKFRFERGYDLNDALRALGMQRAFESRLADFSGITRAEPLFIGFVIHKTFVAVDEDGTEAAAATAVGLRAGSAAPPAEPVPFVADHPFVFLIRHVRTGAVLFVGHLGDPLAG